MVFFINKGIVLLQIMIQTWDKIRGKEKTISKEDSLKFLKYKVENAKDYILQKSKNERDKDTGS